MTETMDPLIDALKEGGPKEEIVMQVSSPQRHSKRTQWRQWLACISATLSMVAVGTVYGWTTTSLSRLTSGASDVPVKITQDESSWIVSLTVIGSMIGPFLGAGLADRYGRKRSLLLASGFFIVGWTVVFFAQSVTALYISRVILGIGVGMSYTANPMYVSEVADVNIRGALGTLISVNVFTGSLLTCSISPWVSYQVLAVLLLAVAVLFVLCFSWFPETPAFLAARGRRAEATRSLAFFKGIRDRDEARRELEQALRNLFLEDVCDNGPVTGPGARTEPVKRSWLVKLKLMLLPSNARALGIVLGLIMAQQLSGNFSTMQYLEVLFKKMAIGLDSNMATVLVLAVGLISSGLSTATVEGAGRRPLLIASTLGSSVTLAILAVYLMLDERGVDMSSMNLLPVIDVIAFQVAFQIGLGTLPSALIGELFPTEVKAFAGAIVTIFDGVLGFAVSKLYQVIGDSLGADIVYYFFAASCLFAFVMVMFAVPETKGRTFREIQELLRDGNKKDIAENVESSQNRNNVA
ncbi:facilitated trehalose transporter Tret1-like isoform X2 [Nylanderia fulva]|uniref:facilitated trehalose transporter Tret1-like isoform X2 n=1 Tax=Nylanderia fulva TaxID=613905 RepID=UPI0010FB2A78|nr:facilitated trehalose transporter Tret1-like isoform X2 [Nylanderia fulva]XP_029171576.1 facilitated trehalose transporter Tret1-like isoform X2 [Nylanderia fulva]